MEAKNITPEAVLNEIDRIPDDAMRRHVAAIALGALNPNDVSHETPNTGIVGNPFPTGESEE